MTKSDLDFLKEKLTELQKQTAKQTTCPSCGHCPTCGHRASPYWPQPVPWYPRPYWQEPYITWTTNGTQITDLGAKTFTGDHVVLGNTVSWEAR